MSFMEIKSTGPFLIKLSQGDMFGPRLDFRLLICGGMVYSVPPRGQK